MRYQEFIFRWGRDGLGPRLLRAEVSKGRDCLGPKCPVTDILGNYKQCRRTIERNSYKSYKDNRKAIIAGTNIVKSYTPPSKPEGRDLVGWLFGVQRPFGTVFQSISLYRAVSQKSR